MTVAHIAGVPVEESLLTLTPVLPLLALSLRARMTRVIGRRRHRDEKG
jgi:hypothetical protein